MGAHVRHPWILALLRTVLYFGATTLGLVLLGATALFLVSLTFFGLLSLALVGGGGELIVVVGALGLVMASIGGYALVSSARRIDRFLLRTARVPTPLEQVHSGYVRGEIDEGELERQIERVLTGDSGVFQSTRGFIPPVRVRPETISTTTVDSDREAEKW